MTGMRMINEKMLVTTFIPQGSCGEIIRGLMQTKLLYFFFSTQCSAKEWNAIPCGK